MDGLMENPWVMVLLYWGGSFLFAALVLFVCMNSKQREESEKKALQEREENA